MLFLDAPGDAPTRRQAYGFGGAKGGGGVGGEREKSSQLAATTCFLLEAVGARERYQPVVRLKARLSEGVLRNG